MKILLNDLASYASSTLNFLGAARVLAAEDLSQFFDYNFEVPLTNRHFISCSSRPSEKNTSAFVISYIVNDTGIPLEIRMNLSLGYSKFTVKCTEQVERYNPFLRDSFTNIIQSLDLHTTDMEAVKGELNIISKLGINTR